MMKKPAHHFLTAEDGPIFRLFDSEEKDAAVQAVSTCDDQPDLGHFAQAGVRTQLAAKLRERVLVPLEEYMGRSLEALEGRAAPGDLQAACVFQVEVERVAQFLEEAEGSVLSGDHTAALGQALYDAWTALQGEAAAALLSRKVPEELEVEREQRKKNSENGANNEGARHQVGDHKLTIKELVKLALPKDQKLEHVTSRDVMDRLHGCLKNDLHADVREEAVNGENRLILETLEEAEDGTHEEKAVTISLQTIAYHLRNIKREKSVPITRGRPPKGGKK